MNFNMDNLARSHFCQNCGRQGESSKGDIIETFLNILNKKSVYIKIHHLQESANYSLPPVPQNSVLESSYTQLCMLIWLLSGYCDKVELL